VNTDWRRAVHSDVGNQVFLDGSLSMVQSIDSVPVEPEPECTPGVQFVHSLLRFLQAVRYRKNLVIAVLVAAVLLCGL